MDIEIISGFLGAGKTTFLNKYLSILKGKTVVIENEFGEIGFDGDLIDSNVPVWELYAGCICCSLSMDLQKSIRDIIEQYNPDRILIEPSGIGRLSDIVRACERIKETGGADIRISRQITIVDASAFEECVEDFGSFYLDQIVHAQQIFLSQLERVSEEKRHNIIELLRKENPNAFICEEEWRNLEGETLKKLIDSINIDQSDLAEMSSQKVPREFTTFSILKPKKTSKEQIQVWAHHIRIKKYGYISRVKGIVPVEGGGWLKIDITPAYINIEKALNCRECKLIFIGWEMEEAQLRSVLEQKFA